MVRGRIAGPWQSRIAGKLVAGRLHRGLRCGAADGGRLVHVGRGLALGWALVASLAWVRSQDSPAPPEPPKPEAKKDDKPETKPVETPAGKAPEKSAGTPAAKPEQKGAAGEESKPAVLDEAARKALLEALKKAAAGKGAAAPEAVQALEAARAAATAQGDETKKEGAVQVDLDASLKKDEAPAKEPGASAGAAAAPARPPAPPTFRLRDGTRLAGEVAVKTLSIDTPYGRLVVPVPEVVQVRFAAKKDPLLAGRIDEEVKALGSEEFDRREAAVEELRRIGLPALEALKTATASQDAEVKSRAEKLVAELEEDVDEDESDSPTAPIRGDDDELVTLKFTAIGKVIEETFNLKTRYGTLDLSRTDIVSIVFRESPRQRSAFDLPGNTFAGNKQWFDTKLTLAQGQSLKIAASGQINLENYGQMTGPEGTTNISGNQLESFPSGSVVGRIGEKGKPFLIGAEFEGTANASGVLHLGVSLQNGQASGVFKVEVETEEES